jgi:hypothetical protein
MAYEGEEMLACPKDMFDFGNAYAVVVSGDWPNTWGHMLLNTGGTGGVYFQVAGIRTAPRYLVEAGYQRYLSETKKKELKRYRVHIPEPEKSQLKLEQALSEPWLWGVVVHNCETLVEDIIVAGGGPRLHKGVLYDPAESSPIGRGASGSY